MKIKNIKNSYEINLIEIFYILWKKKLFIVILTLLFGLISYIYSENFIEKKFQASLKILPVANTEFLKLNEVYNFLNSNEILNSSRNFSNEFYKKFVINLLSIDNIANYISNNKDKYEFFLKKFDYNNIRIKNYLSKNFKLKQNDYMVKKSNLNNNYHIILNYPDGVNGDKILNDYVIYKANFELEKLYNNFISILEFKRKINEKEKLLYLYKAEKEIENKLLQLSKDLQEYKESQKRNIDSKLVLLTKDLEEYLIKKKRSNQIEQFVYEQELKIAKSIGLEDSVISSVTKNNINSSIINEPKSLFYQGEKALSARIETIKEKADKINLTKQYNEILSSIEKNRNQLDFLDQTQQYNEILNAIEKNKNQLDFLDQTQQYNEILNAIEKNKNQLDFIDKTDNYIKFLSVEIELVDKIDLIKNLNIEWKPILDVAVDKAKLIHPNSYLNILLGSLLGFSVSLIIIFLRNRNYR